MNDLLKYPFSRNMEVVEEILNTPEFKLFGYSIREIKQMINYCKANNFDLKRIEDK
jgi:hypothetical protein